MTSAPNRQRWLALLLGLVLTGVAAWVDDLTGADVEASLFYLVPIGVVSWFSWRWAGIILSFLSAGSWLAVSVLSLKRPNHPQASWSFAYVQFVFFLTTTLVLSALRRALEREKALARTDPLTGVANRQAFRETGGMALALAQRTAQPLTLAYMDLDHFKALNDRRGHQAGDDCLKAVADMARSRLRATDLMARLGGDEFAFLLPGTGPDKAGEVLDGLRQALLAEMRRRDWPVTFSIGAVAFAKAPAALDDMVRQADALMYTVKQDGKDGVILKTGEEAKHASG